MKRLKYFLPIAAIALGITISFTGCGEKTAVIDEANNRIAQGKYEEALTVLAGAERDGEDEKLIARGRGISYLYMEEYDTAIGYFLKALALTNGFYEPVDIDINKYLAEAYSKCGDYREALGCYDAILNLTPNDYNAMFLRANVRLLLGDVNGATDDFDLAIAAHPDKFSWQIQVYEVLSEFGYKETATEYLESALKNGIKTMSAYELGRVYYYLEDYRKAYSNLEKARKETKEKADSDYDPAKCYLYLGRAYEATGDFNYALTVYESFISKYPEGDAMIYNQLGVCEMRKGMYEDALRHISLGILIGDETVNRALMQNEIAVYEYLGDFDMAKTLTQSYLEKYPDNEEVKREERFLNH